MRLKKNLDIMKIRLCRRNDSKDSKKTYMTLLERMTKKYIVVEMNTRMNV